MPLPTQHPATKGFSLRQHLTDSGVTTEDATRHHLAGMYFWQQQYPELRVTRYRVNPANPNACGYDGPRVFPLPVQPAV